MIRPLTKREIEVLCRVPSSNKQIATALNISVGTVKNHFTTIALKLGTTAPPGGRESNRTKSLLVALKEGMITLDDVIMGPLRKSHHEY